jgi:hypothetical protein
MTMDTGDNTELAQAFNLGSDARCKGLEKNSNPYDSAAEWQEWLSWRKGWDDANDNWGSEDTRRWPIRFLPVVGSGERLTTL